MMIFVKFPQDENEISQCRNVKRVTEKKTADDLERSRAEAAPHSECWSDWLQGSSGKCHPPLLGLPFHPQKLEV